MTIRATTYSLSWIRTCTLSSFCAPACLLLALRAFLPWVLLCLYVATSAPNGAVTTPTLLFALLVLLLCTIIVILRYRRWMCRRRALALLRLVRVRYATVLIGTLCVLRISLCFNGTCMPNALTGTVSHGKQQTILLIHTYMHGYAMAGI